MALAVDQVADGDQRLARQSEAGADGVTIRQRAEHVGLHAVAQRDGLGRIGAKLQQHVAKRRADTDHRVGAGDRLLQHPAWTRVLRDQVHIRAPGGNHHRKVQLAADPHRGDAVGVEIMRVDRIELRPLGNQPGDVGQRRPIQQPGRDRHADLRDHQITRMMDGKAIPLFNPGHGSVLRPGAEARRSERKKRHRRNHGADRLAARNQMAEAVLHENAVVWLDAVGKQRGEGQQSDRGHARLIVSQCLAVSPAQACREEASVTPSLGWRDGS